MSADATVRGKRVDSIAASGVVGSEGAECGNDLHPRGESRGKGGPSAGG